MTSPATPPPAPVPTPPRRRFLKLPVWAWVLIGVLAIVPCAIGGLAVAIIGYGAGSATSESDEQESDRLLQAADPAGGTACNYADMFVAGGIGSEADILERAKLASTPGIRAAATAQQLVDACRAAGANMSE